MPKVKRLVPIDSSRPIPWGATKKRGAQNAEIRGLKNRIHQLEQELAAANRAVALATTDVREARRACDETIKRLPPRDALWVIARISVADARRLGVLDELGQLAAWLDSGKEAINVNA